MTFDSYFKSFLVYVYEYSIVLKVTFSGLSECVGLHMSFPKSRERHTRVIGVGVRCRCHWATAPRKWPSRCLTQSIASQHSRPCLSSYSSTLTIGTFLLFSLILLRQQQQQLESTLQRIVFLMQHNIIVQLLYSFTFFSLSRPSSTKFVHASLLLHAWGYTQVYLFLALMWPIVWHYKVTTVDSA